MNVDNFLIFKIYRISIDIFINRFYIEFVIVKVTLLFSIL